MTCAVYIRKSREDKSKPAHRLTVQRQQLPTHARAQGWSVEIYDDGHASAARGKVEDLKERARLEADIRAGKINVVLCIELSRLSRDDSLQDYVAWLHLCSQHGVKLATLSRILDPSQHSDWMLLLMEGGFSSVEMRVLKQRMDEGRRQALRAGRYISGNPPIPYRYDKATRNLVVDPHQLKIFERMCRLLEKHSAKEVARRVGLPHITVRRAISDDRLLMYQALREDPETGEIIRCQWPAVLTADQASRIRANRVNRISGYRRRPAASLLTNLGLFICGYCGRSIRAWKGNRRQEDGEFLAYYGCSAKEGRDCSKSRMINQPDIDRRIIGNLLGTLERIDEIAGWWHLHQRDGDIQADIESLEKRASELQAAKQRLVAAIAEGVISFADARDQRQRIEDDMAEVAGEMDMLRGRLATQPDWASLDISAAEWEVLDIPERRSVISVCIKQIKMYDTYLTITYQFPRSADGQTTSRVHLPPRLKPGRKKRPKSKT